MLGGSLVLYFIYFHLQYFGDVTFLGEILLLEVIIASLWKYDQRFFVLLMITFVWAGMHVPLQSAWTIGRWVVLSAGAVVGLSLIHIYETGVVLSTGGGSPAWIKAHCALCRLIPGSQASECRHSRGGKLACG